MKISKRIIILLFAVFLLLAAAGCGEGGGTPAGDIRPSSSASLPAPAPEKQAREAAGQETQPDDAQPPAEAALTDRPAAADEPGLRPPAGKASERSAPKARGAAAKPAVTQEAGVPEEDGENKGEGSPPVEEKTVCTIAVYGDGNTVLEPVRVEFKDGDSVLDILKKATRGGKIQMEYRGGEKSGAYVEGIDNLYEFDRGAESGWMYSVNGNYPNYGCGAYKVEKGDTIEWRYTKDLGKDLGADMSGTDGR